MGHPIALVLEYYLVSYRRTWRASAFSSFVLPLLTVLGFGLGVGEFVDRRVDGVPYLDFLMPGLVASTALQVAVGDASWPVMGNFQWFKMYYAQVASPLRVGDIVGGHQVFIQFRVLLSSAAFLLVAALFGTLRSPWAVAMLAIVVLIGLAAGAPTMAFAAAVEQDSFLILLLRFVIIPMSLFSGVFFPVESLAVGLRAVAYVLPLWHGVELCRLAALGSPTAWPVVAHVGYLGLWAVAGLGLSMLAFRRRLVR
ncbi:MAG TPA: ABC transporter permease [Pilimelia sp.]|nr:ABC transporter permease [Pilimelia sp.]